MIFRVVPTKTTLKLHYWNVTKRKIDFKNPKRFTEKIHWYKINYKNDLMTTCADKYKVRNFISNLGYEDNLVKLYQVVDRVEDINYKFLPKRFVIKANNGSGTNIFVDDKDSIDLNEIKRVTRKWGRVNTINLGKEWAYKNIKRKIIVEEFIDDYEVEETSLRDYKVLCFHGEPKLIWVDINRNSNHKRNFYDLEWEQLKVKSDRENESIIQINKPEKLTKMLEISKSISKHFPFVRVDFYYTKTQRLYIGEVTFYPWSGSVNFTPDEFDFELGRLLDLTKF